MDLGKDLVRKGPWTEEEDIQLVFYVNLFGDRRWDFVAKVSGLKRTGKSCRLRWVNYLHPGLKRGKMTPHEERLVLQLHSKWGNRWSRIASKLPGRTDNEIKNYWRTHMRKKAQERKKGALMSPSSSSSHSTIFSTASNSDSMETKERSFYDTGGRLDHVVAGEKKTGLEVGESTIDEIWKDILSDDQSCNITYPSLNFCPIDYLWSMDEKESNMLMQPMSDDQFPSFSLYNNITG